MKRIYEAALAEHLGSLRQMVFLTGPRQVGKTTVALALVDPGRYVNWDKQSDRAVILKGPDAAASLLQLNQLSETSLWLFSMRSISIPNGKIF